MKIKFLLVVAFCFVSSIYAQNESLENCKNICEKTEIVKEGAFLGVRIKTKEVNKVEILEVLTNTAALRHNLIVGDLITKLDGVFVNNQFEFRNSIKAHQPDDIVSLTYIRNEKEVTQRITLGAFSTKLVTTKVCCDDVAQLELENSLKVYPIPAKDKVTVESSSFKGEYTIELYNSLGVFVDEFKGNANSSVSKVIEVSKYESGNYYIRVNNNGKIVSKNILIVR